MWDRGRYDSAMFWRAVGAAASVIGLALMSIGVGRSAPGTNLLANPWFDAGLVLLAVGGLLLLWALGLYLMRRRIKAEAEAASGSPASENKDNTKPTTAVPNKSAWMLEAIRGYYAERDKMLNMWDRQERNRGRNK